MLCGLLVGVLLSRSGRRTLGLAVRWAVRLTVMCAGVLIAYAAIVIIQAYVPVLVPSSPELQLVASVSIVAVVAIICAKRLQCEHIGD